MSDDAKRKLTVPAHALIVRLEDGTELPVDPHKQPTEAIASSLARHHTIEAGCAYLVLHANLAARAQAHSAPPAARQAIIVASTKLLEQQLVACIKLWESEGIPHDPNPDRQLNVKSAPKILLPPTNGKPAIATRDIVKDLPPSVRRRFK